MEKTEQDNLEIAKMLGWIDEDGDLIVPRKLSQGYDYREWAVTKEIEIDGLKESFYINVTMVGFRFDWKWLMEAVNFIENMGKDTHVQITKNSCEIKQDQILIHTQADTKIEAVFQAVSQFAVTYNKREI